MIFIQHNNSFNERFCISMNAINLFEIIPGDDGR